MEQSAAQESGERRTEPYRWLAEAIDRHRKLFFAGIAFLHLICFNGQWKIGRDSALYRGLARSIASGKGYTFGEFAPQAVYPGYPLLLAGIEKVFGPGALAPLIVMYVLAALVLVYTYRLIQLRYPRWMAVCVVCGVGYNGWFLELSHELLTDVPFLLGVVLALYGWERLRSHAGAARELTQEHLEASRPASAAAQRTELARALGYLLIGLIIAATTRPTFWILALAWVATCIWGLITGPRRFYAICLAAIGIVALLILLLDPRTRGFDPLGGAYEADAVAMLGRAADNVPAAAVKMLGKDLPGLYFGGRFAPGLTHLISLVLIGSSLLLWRRHKLWALLVPATVAVTLVMSTVPRYYLMVLPLMLLSWLLMLILIARRVPPRWAGAVIFAGLSLVVLPNLVRCVRVVADQWVRNPGGMTAWGEMVELAQVVKENTPADARIIGPAAPILSYFSERQVYMAKELIPRNKKPVQYPRHLDSLGIDYAVFGPGLYMKAESIIDELMERGVVMPGRRVARYRGMTLAEAEIVIPAGDWRKTPKSAVAAIETSVNRPRPTTDEFRRREVAERRAAAERAERRQRLELHEARRRIQRRRERDIPPPVTAPAPSTAPVSTPPSQSTTQPAPATVPITRGPS